MAPAQDLLTQEFQEEGAVPCVVSGPPDGSGAHLSRSDKEGRRRG